MMLSIPGGLPYRRGRFRRVDLSRRLLTSERHKELVFRELGARLEVQRILTALLP